MFGVPMLRRSLEAARRDLAHQSGQVRRAVLAELAFGPDSEANERGELAQSALLDQLPIVRSQALLALADLHYQPALPKVIGALSDGELGVRRAALIALGELAALGDSAAFESAVPFLSAQDGAVRFQALQAAFRIWPERAWPYVRAATADSDPELVELGFRLIEEGVNREIYPISEELTALLALGSGSKHGGVRAEAQLICAALGLGGRHDALVELVEGRSASRQTDDIPLAIELCGRLRIEEARRGLRRRAFGWLGYSTDPFRYVALAALAALGEEKAILQVRRGLASGSAVIQAALVHSLGQSLARQFEPELLAMVGQNADLEPVLTEALAQLQRTDLGPLEPAESTT